MSALSFVGLADRAGRASVVVLGASIPVSVALDNLLLAWLGLLWLVGGRWRDKLRMVATNPVVIAVLVLFGLLALGTLYGEAPRADRTHYLGKYIDLLFVPAMLWMLRDQATARLAVRALLASGAVSLAISLLLASGTIAPMRFVDGSAANPIAFKSSITHNVIMAITAYLAVLEALGARDRRVQLVLAALAVLALFDLVFVVRGRTGWVMAAALATYLLVSRLGWRRGGIALLGGCLTVGLAAWHGSTTFNQRVKAVVHDVRTWTPGEPSATDVGVRLEFYANTTKVIQTAPLLGVGTGGFPSAYAQVVAGTRMPVSHNPHNEYLLIAAQLGLVGLTALAALLLLQWGQAARLAPFERDLARGLVLAFAAACMVNSFLIDHTEGLLFAYLTATAFARLGAPEPSRTSS